MVLRRDVQLSSARRPPGSAAVVARGGLPLGTGDVRRGSGGWPPGSAAVGAPWAAVLARPLQRCQMTALHCCMARLRIPWLPVGRGHVQCSSGGRPPGSAAEGAPAARLPQGRADVQLISGRRPPDSAAVGAPARLPLGLGVVLALGRVSSSRACIQLDPRAGRVKAGCIGGWGGCVGSCLRVKEGWATLMMVAAQSLAEAVVNLAAPWGRVRALVWG